MKIEVNNPCCICNSDKSERLFETEFPLHHYPGKFNIYKCTGCGLLYNSPRLSDEKIYALYDKNYYLFNSHVSDEFQRITNVYLRTIALIENLLTIKNVTEVGCGKGFLLAILKKCGWTVQGIEISSEATEFSSSKFGISTYNGTIERFVEDSPNVTYPLVLAIDVIEHVTDPIEFLSQLDRIVDADGFLIIDTPNGNCKNIEHLGKKWSAFNPFHIYFFSIPILENVLKRIGYSIEMCFTYGNHIEKKDLIWDLKSLLIKMNLFLIFKKTYNWIISKTEKREENLELLINRTIETIHGSPNYLQTADSIAELAKDFRGHNILIIAKKIRF